jgi:transposase-like protein|tara:strand:- start:1045 stop:1326 length:282 start_codon:yes stop_codon:yes gene_type:complete
MKKYRAEQIVEKLRQSDVELGRGLTVKEVCRKVEISEQTYYRWRQKYGGMSPELIKELRALQKENQRLRKIVADQRIDMEILKEAIEYNSKNS